MSNLWSNSGGEPAWKWTRATFSREKEYSPPRVRYKVEKDAYGKEWIWWSYSGKNGLARRGTKTDLHWREDIGEGGWISLWQRMWIAVRDPMGTRLMRVHGERRRKGDGGDRKEKPYTPQDRYKIMKGGDGKMWWYSWSLCPHGSPKAWKRRGPKTDRNWKEDIGEVGCISLWDRMCIAAKDPMGATPVRFIRSSVRRAEVEEMNETGNEKEDSVKSNKALAERPSLWTRASSLVCHPGRLVLAPRGRKSFDDLEEGLLSSSSSAAPL